MTPTDRRHIGRAAAHSDLTVDSEAVTVESDEPTDAEVEAAKGARA